MNKKLIVIAGPTASGKTQLAVDMALKYDTSIISADSRQCYREMNIGVAKPTEIHLQQVPHYFINSHSIQEEINAADFSILGDQYLTEIFTVKDIAIVVGGTGLYIKALCEGLDLIPEINERVQEDVYEDFRRKGIEDLLVQIQKHDPVYLQQAVNGEERNSHRLMRALIVKLSTGKSILAFRNSGSKKNNFAIEYHVIDWDKEILYQRINDRVIQMIEHGLVQEVKGLLAFSKLKNLQTIGYQEIFAYLNDECSLETAIENLQQNTRNYAKRQITWFKKLYPDTFCTLTALEKKLL